MTSTAEEKKALLIDKIVTAVGQRLPADVAPLAQVFARQYFAWCRRKICWTMNRRISTAPCSPSGTSPASGSREQC